MKTQSGAGGHEHPHGDDGCACPICRKGDPDAPSETLEFEHKGRRIEVQVAPAHALKIDGFDVMTEYEPVSGMYFAHAISFIGFPTLEELARYIADAELPVDSPAIRSHTEAMEGMDSMSGAGPMDGMEEMDDMDHTPPPRRDGH